MANKRPVYLAEMRDVLKSLLRSGAAGVFMAAFTLSTLAGGRTSYRQWPLRRACRDASALAFSDPASPDPVRGIRSNESPMYNRPH